MSGRTLVLGLGNPILGDDGVGWRVVERVRGQVESPEVEVDCFAGGGLSLMERLVGYDRAILVDVTITGQRPPGSVCALALEQLADPAVGHVSSPHDVTLQTALLLGRALGIRLPDRITIVGVEVETSYEFAEELTAPVAAAVPRAVQLTLDELRRSVG